MSATTTFPRDDARRVRRLAAAKERRHAVMDAARRAAPAPKRRSHSTDWKKWRPGRGTLAFDVLGYASYDICTTNEIAWHLGRHPKDIRPLVSQLRKAGLVLERGPKNGDIVEATVLGGGYFAREEAAHGFSVLASHPNAQAPGVKLRVY